MAFCCYVFSVSFVSLIVELFWKPSAFRIVRVCVVSSFSEVCKQLVCK